MTEDVHRFYATARFWSMVDRRGPDECWEWLGHRHVRGYGIFWCDGKNVRANRMALIYSGVEPPSNDLGALHSCDNPPCCNPAHLRWGTDADNAADKVLRKPSKGEQSPHSTITNDIVAEIYRLRLSGMTSPDIAAKLGLTKTLVMNIYTGRAWKHRLGVDGNPTLDELRSAKPSKARIAHNKVVSDEIADAILRGRMDGRTAADLSASLGLPLGTVSPVFCGLSCRHRLGVDGNPTFDELRAVRAVPKNLKLFEDDITSIVALLRQGYTGRSISEQYGVSPATISGIKKSHGC